MLMICVSLFQGVKCQLFYWPELSWNTHTSIGMIRSKAAAVMVAYQPKKVTAYSHGINYTLHGVLLVLIIN